MLRRCLFVRCSVALGSFYGKNCTVSPRAWQRIHEVNAAECFQNETRYLRLAIDSGGCHGYLYKFEFEPISKFDAAEDVLFKATDAEVQARWETLQANDSRDAAVAPIPPDAFAHSPPPQMVIDRHSIEKLEGAVVDYHSELKGSAFVVVGNELVDQSCACALSFSIKKRPKRDATGVRATHTNNRDPQPASQGSTPIPEASACTAEKGQYRAIRRGRVSPPAAP